MSTADGLLLEAKPSGGLHRMDIYEPAGYALPWRYRPYYTRVLNLPIRDDDVWIVSHPKCGSLWMSEMVWLLRNSLDFEAAQQSNKERIPFFEHSTLLFNSQDDEKVEAMKKPLPMFLADSIGFVDQWPKSNGPRTIKTHLHWNVLPKNLRLYNSKAKVIYVAREAKDVCVSYYHHLKMIQSYSGSFEEFAELFIRDELMYAPFWKHVLEFWEQRDRGNLLFLKYEDMKKDLNSIIQKLNEFLNLPPLTDEAVNKLTRHLSLKSMKSNKAVNVANFISAEEGGKLVECNEGGFVRKGIVGGWKEVMSPQLASRFDKWSEKHITGSGLVF